MAEFDRGVKLITDTTAREPARVAGLACRWLTPLKGTLPGSFLALCSRSSS
jgi:hypothetical protein